MTNILLLNGPNLNMLGAREPDKYGSLTLADIVQLLESKAQAFGCDLQCYQKDAEHELIKLVHDALQDSIKFILLNPAAYTHTSIALRDALLAVNIPFIEVHLSNIHAREDFRKHSYFSDIAVGVISGLGPIGYELALQAAIAYLKDKETN